MISEIMPQSESEQSQQLLDIKMFKVYAHADEDESQSSVEQNKLMSLNDIQQMSNERLKDLFFQADLKDVKDEERSKFFQIKKKVIGSDDEKSKTQTLIQLIDVSHKIYYLDIRS